MYIHIAIYISKALKVTQFLGVGWRLLCIMF